MGVSRLPLPTGLALGASAGKRTVEPGHLRLKSGQGLLGFSRVELDADLGVAELRRQKDTTPDTVTGSDVASSWFSTSNSE